MVRQLRRITSLKIRIQKLQSFTEIWYRTWKDIHTEWNVILKADFKMEKFETWIQNIPELTPVPVELPTHEWLSDCEQIVRHAVTQQEAVEKKLIKDIGKIRHETDVKVGHKVETFKHVKGKDFPPFQKILHHIEDIGIVVPLDQKNKWNIFVDRPQRFKELHNIQVEDKKAILTAIGSHSIYVEFATDIDFVQEEVSLKQEFVETDLQEVFHSLTTYWMQFWGRDKGNNAEQSFDDDYLAHLLDS